jgi:hypothetical protein
MEQTFEANAPTETASESLTPEPDHGMDESTPESEHSDPAIPTPDQISNTELTWRIRTPTGLIMAFPNIRHAMTFAEEMNEAKMGLARGVEDFRPMGMFRSRLSPRIDPEVIFDSTPFESLDDAGSHLPSEERSPLPSSPLPQDELGRELEAARTRKPRTIQKEFAFRTSITEGSWFERILFLMFGLIVGGGVIYYLAWLGLLPGIRY